MTTLIERDTLFLLRPDFRDDDTVYLCPHSKRVEELLNLRPELLGHFDVRHLDFPRPRPALVALLGEANQSAPVLVLRDDRPEDDLVRRAGDVAFVGGAEDIGRYFERTYGSAQPH